ncbi:unnamed protein product [Allacma fusca]|uniref:HTH CENPB-type domain-containing protein n=1 Tax=Allacma fusca TaxID=39272 RepID=A0A8J2KL71_9HEXA|nr:unnamed protein product [Allacma fusca]
MYGVSKSTIHKYRHASMESIPDLLSQGRFKKVFTDSQEEEIIRYSLELTQRFYALTRRALGLLAFTLAEQNGIIHPFTNGTAGEDWIAGFLERHPELSFRTGTPTSLARIRGFNKPAVYRFFDNLEAMVLEHGFTGMSIYNVDETGLTIVPGKAPKRLALRGVKSVPVMVPVERGRLVTLVCCFGATGTYVPPLFLFPGEINIKTIGDGPIGSCYATSKKGWSTTDSFLIWLKHFKKFVTPSTTNPILLILDNHSSHISYEAVSYCRRNFIHILTLPPHTSHKTQPLDRSFFSPLKTYYGQALTSWLSSHKYMKPRLQDIPCIIRPALEKASKQETAENGFNVTGIWVKELSRPDRYLENENQADNEGEIYIEEHIESNFNEQMDKSNEGDIDHVTETSYNDQELDDNDHYYFIDAEESDGDSDADVVPENIEKSTDLQDCNDFHIGTVCNSRDVEQHLIYTQENVSLRTSASATATVMESSSSALSASAFKLSPWNISTDTSPTAEPTIARKARARGRSEVMTSDAMMTLLKIKQMKKKRTGSDSEEKRETRASVAKKSRQLRSGARPASQ